MLKKVTPEKVRKRVNMNNSGRPQQLEFDWGQEDPTFLCPPELHACPSTEIKARLEHQTGLQIDLSITECSQLMLAFRIIEEKKKVLVHMHSMFLCASEDVINHIAKWLLNPNSKRSCSFLQEHIRKYEIIARQNQGATHRYKIIHQGRFFNLGEIFKQVNQSSFNNEVTATVTWSRHTKGKARSIRLGSYRSCCHLIRINPRLDQKFVPLFFIRHVIYHEMLHSIFPRQKTASGRNSIHSKEFRALERKSPDYEAATQWEKTPGNIGRLLGRQKP